MASSNEQQALREAVEVILSAPGLLGNYGITAEQMAALRAAHDAPNAYGDRDVAALISDAQAWLGDGPAPPARKILEALAALPAAPAMPASIVERAQAWVRWHDGGCNGEGPEHREEIVRDLAKLPAAPSEPEDVEKVLARLQHRLERQAAEEEWGPGYLNKVTTAIQEMVTEKPAPTDAERDTPQDVLDWADAYSKERWPDPATPRMQQMVAVAEFVLDVHHRRARPTDAERVTKGLERDRDDARQQLGDVRIALEDAGYERKTLAAAVKALDEDRTDACQKRDALRKQLDEAKAKVDRLANELDPPVCRLQLPDGSVPGNAREAAEMWHAACQEMWKQRDKAKTDLDDARESIGTLRPSLKEITRQRDELLAEACRWYRADGTFDVLDSPEAVIEKRKEAAKVLARAKAAANARAVEELEAFRDRQLPLAVDPSSPLGRTIRGALNARIADLETEPQPITTVLTPEDMGAELQRELPQPSTEPEQPEQQANLKHSVEQLLRMIAMVPEQQLPGMGIDPYGRIGDALEAIGQPRKPDSWRALSKWAHGYDCGEYVEPEQPEDDGGGDLDQWIGQAERIIDDNDARIGGLEGVLYNCVISLRARVRKLEVRR